MPKHKLVHLVARRDFGDYRRGALIDDADAVNRIMKSEHRHHVVKIRAKPEPKPTAMSNAASAPVAVPTASPAPKTETMVPAAK